MMKYLVVFVALVSLGQAAIWCGENYCDRVRCAAVTTENCDGRIVQKGDRCRCCPVCRPQLKLGEKCRPPMPGPPPKNECSVADNLICDWNTWTCVKKTNNKRDATKNCAAVAAEKNARLEASKQNGKPLYGLSVPKCDEDGTYAAKQCSGSVCYCVDKLGTQIDGKANRWEAQDMDCKCSRDKMDYFKTGLIGRLFFCQDNGNYRTVG